MNTEHIPNSEIELIKNTVLDNPAIETQISSEKIQVDEITATLFHLVLEDERFDFSKIEMAYRFAKKAHDGVLRKSGQPYIVHPVSVAIILIKELRLDTDTVCAALLHDVIEDTSYQFNDIKRNFGNDVAILVDGVSKITNIKFMTKDENHAESIKKLFLAISKDIRVLFIKVCDRLHNIRTLKFFKPEKQRRIALETMYIYASLADRIGMHAIKEELEDRSIRYLDPYGCETIDNFLEGGREQRERFIEKIKTEISKRFTLSDYKREPYIQGRIKSTYGIYKKVYIQNRGFGEVYDKYAVRVIVSTKAECYNVLGLIHDIYTPIPNRFKDYIALPKENGYQSIQTTVIGEDKIPFEVQIRTWEMHETAEFGIAAHWKYKQGLFGKDKMDEYLSFIRQALEIQREGDGSEDLIEILKTDYASETIMVLTPKGDTVTLPVGATAIDFAYRIHTDVGHRATGVLINAKIGKIDQVLNTGDVVEMLLGKHKRPNRNWLTFVVTNEAKSKIRSFFKNQQKSQNISIGKAKLHKEFVSANIYVPDEDLEKFLAADMRRHNCSTLEDFYASIGYGGIVVEHIIPRLYNEYKKQYEDPLGYYEEKISTIKTPDNTEGISLGEVTAIETRYAKCCNPLPGDEIVGFVTRGGYMTVHRYDCVNFLNSVRHSENRERWHKITWKDKKQVAHEVKIEIVAADRIGLNLDITKIFADNRINLLSSSSRNIKDGQAIFEASMLVANVEQVELLILKLKKIKDVVSVYRR